MSRGNRGQSAPVGIALLLGLVILGTTAVVALGGAALSDTQEQSNIARAEQSMTLFDSQAAQVALGDSETQTVDLGQSDGTYSVDPDAGEISIIQLDCDDNGTNDDGDDTAGGSPTASLSTDDDAYILSPTSLGSFTYETRDGTLAYQGGGVWQKDSSGGVAMVSPPEFHYRGATLTLPVVLTRGSSGASGNPRATVTRGSTTRVFADSSQQFPDRCEQSGDEYFTNPVADGTVVVRVESEYAKAWGEYVESRTSGLTSYKDTDGDGDTDVALIRLISLGTIGEFAMPGEGGAKQISGASGGHETETYSVTLKPDGADSAEFDNLQWSMYVEEGTYQMEVHLRRGSGSDGDCSDGNTDLHADLDIYFSPDGGDTYYGWHKDDAYAAECENYDTSDPEDEIKLTADFADDEDGNGDGGTYKPWTDTDENDPELEYVDKNNMNNLVHFTINGDTPSDPYTIDGHGGDDPWEPSDYTKNNGERETVDRLINHYFAELPSEFELTVDDKNSDTISEAGSAGEIRTRGSGRYVTYLHVTTNEVEVEVDG
jgi:Tfp pilus assembly protein PilX